MDFNQFNNLEDFMKFCGCDSNNTQSSNKNTKTKGKTKKNKKSSKDSETSSSSGRQRCENCRPSNGQAQASESVRYSDSDIPGGFQDIPPQLLLVIGELIGNITAGNLPFNIQNVVGNWLQLVGQAIEVFNAQQQYFQGGPGRYYNQVYRNVANPFCTDETSEEQKSIVVDESDTLGANSNSNTSGTASMEDSQSTSGSSNYEKEIEGLKECISILSKEMENLKYQIEDLKKKT